VTDAVDNGLCVKHGAWNHVGADEIRARLRLVSVSVLDRLASRSAEKNEEHLSAL